MDLASSLTTEGPLEKQSPNVFKMYQSRYFAIRGKGDFLVWFKKKPTNPNQDPKGIINIDTIKQIIEDQQDDRLFSIVYLQRKFNLRAQSVAVKQRWVNSLNIIIAHHKKLNKINKAKLLEKEVESWKWKSNANQQITQLIRIENEEVLLQHTENTIGQKNQMLLAEITKQKNLTQIQKCIIYGFYTKKRTLNSHLRWYFLISGVNLKDEKDQEMYTAPEQFLNQLNLATLENKKSSQVQSNKQKNNDSSSSDEEQQIQQVKNNVKAKEQNMKKLHTNVLYQYDPQTKQIKHFYNLIDIVSFEMKTNQKPYQLKITYQQVINEEQQEIKENEIVLTSEFLIQIRKLNTALSIINQKYNMQKQRQYKNANKSKRYPAKKWRYVNEEQWRIPEGKATLYVLLNKKMMRVNTLTIDLQDIDKHSKECVSVPNSGNNNNYSSSNNNNSNNNNNNNNNSNSITGTFMNSLNNISLDDFSLTSLAGAPSLNDLTGPSTPSNNNNNNSNNNNNNNNNNSNNNEQKFMKKEDVLLVKFKKNDEELKIYIQFDKIQTLSKFIKKLSKNIKKLKEEIKAENSAKVINLKMQDKKTLDIYMIDKKIRQTNLSIKVNFYQMMDREVIMERKEKNNESSGFFDKIKAMFCAGPSTYDMM